MAIKMFRIIAIVTVSMVRLNVLAMDKSDDRCDLVKITVNNPNNQAILQARKELRFAILHHKKEVVESLLYKTYKCSAGYLMRDNANKYDPRVFQDAFTETTPAIRDLVIESSFQEDLGIFFWNTLSLFHEIKEKNKSNPHCFIFCGWLDEVLRYFNKRNPLMYSLSDKDRSLLDL